jgi:hypothetical protein
VNVVRGSAMANAEAVADFIVGVFGGCTVLETAGLLIIGHAEGCPNAPRNVFASVCEGLRLMNESEYVPIEREFASSEGTADRNGGEGE